jgi:L-iditol 2-dehydrogenase
VQLARVVGASLVVAVDVDPFRLELARNVGADAALAAGPDVVDRFKEINGGRLADMVIVATGAPRAIQQAFRAVDRGGNILFFAPSDPGAGVDMPFNEIWRKEIAVTTSYGGSPRDISAAIDLLASGRIQAEPMITHRLPLEKTVDGFGLVAKAHGSLKVIIHPHGGQTG